MFERGFSVDDVRAVLTTGEAIEEYPDDFPFPSRLVLGFVQERPVHVVAAHSAQDETIIITVYEPDATEWESGFKKRK